MNIGFYGTSIARYQNKQKWNFINLIQDKFNARIVHSGINQCSEERILFNLKKTKNLDLAIIFHAPPYNIFIPAWNRDITNIDKSTFNKKITMRDWLFNNEYYECTIDELEKVSKQMESIPNGACFQLLESYDMCLPMQFDNYSEAFEKWVEGDSKDIKEILLNKIRSVKNDEKFYEELWTAFEFYKKYLYHPDLLMNRYYGSLIQIDHYLVHKKIPCIHFLNTEKWYPNWVKLSGPVDTNLQKIHRNTSPYYIGYEKSDNGLNEEGNKIIYERILELLADSSIEENVSNHQLEEGGSIPPSAPN